MKENISNKSYLNVAFIAVAICMIATLWISHKNLAPSNSWLIIYSLVIIFFYFSIIHSISNSKEDLEHEDIFKTVCTYILLNISIITFFAYAGLSFNSFNCGENCSNIKLIDAFYYSTVSLTTIGFGDILPVNNAGKILLIIEALIGSVNSVAFISIVFLKFKK